MPVLGNREGQVLRYAGRFQWVPCAERACTARFRPNFRRERTLGAQGPAENSRVLPGQPDSRCHAAYVLVGPVIPSYLTRE